MSPQPILNQSEIKTRFLPLLEKKGRLFRKKTNVLAKKARGGEEVRTVTDDGQETINRAKPGDFIVKNQTEAGEMYIIKPQNFHERYEWLEEADNGFSEYHPTGRVIALELTKALLSELDLPTPFYFKAPWGEDSVAREGDFMVTPPDQSEMYRIARKEFFETYEPV